MLPKEWEDMTPKERIEKPWLEPSQMELARQVLANAKLTHLKIFDQKPRRKPTLSTRCPRGHARTPENLRIYHYGNSTVRQCARCIEIRQALRKEKRRRAEREALAVLKKYGVPATLRQVAVRVA